MDIWISRFQIRKSVLWKMSSSIAMDCMIMIGGILGIISSHAKAVFYTNGMPSAVKCIHLFTPSVFPGA